MLSSDMILNLAEEKRNEVIDFLVTWNDVIAKKMFGDNFSTLGARGIAIEMFDEVLSAVQEYDSPKKFAYPDSWKEFLDRSINESKENEQSKKAGQEMIDFFTVVCHLCNENEHGDINNPEPNIPDLTCRIALEAVQAHIIGAQTHNVAF